VNTSRTLSLKPLQGDRGLSAPIERRSARRAVPGVAFSDAAPDYCRPGIHFVPPAGRTPHGAWSLFSGGVAARSTGRVDERGPRVGSHAAPCPPPGRAGDVHSQFSSAAAQLPRTLRRGSVPSMSAGRTRQVLPRQRGTSPRTLLAWTTDPGQPRSAGVKQASLPAGWGSGICTVGCGPMGPARSSPPRHDRVPGLSGFSFPILPVDFPELETSPLVGACSTNSPGPRAPRPDAGRHPSPWRMCRHRTGEPRVALVVSAGPASTRCAGAVLHEAVVATVHIGILLAFDAGL